MMMRRAVLLAAGGVLLLVLAAAGVALLVWRGGTPAVPTPSAGGVPWPPWALGAPRYRWGFHLVNDTGADALVRRLHPDAAASARLAAGEVLEVTTATPLLRGVDLSDPGAGVVLVLDVEDGAGQSRGRLEFTAGYLVGTTNATICLAAAAEPPFHVGWYCDALRSCPQYGFRCGDAGEGQPASPAGTVGR